MLAEKPAVIAKKEVYHVGCPQCKEGFVLHSEPKNELFCPFCKSVLITKVKEDKMRYILNSAVITSPGYYQYRKITLEDALNWLRQDDWESTIGYQETCDAFKIITGVEVPVNRKAIQMKQGDEALIFRLTCRLDNPTLKGNVSKEFILDNCELGLLSKR